MKLIITLLLSVIFAANISFAQEKENSANEIIKKLEKQNASF